MSPARIPVALFAYNRADTLERTLQCLRRDAVPLIHAYCDGARTPAHAPGVAAVRELIRAVNWCEINIIERPVNLGLGKSVVWGVTEVLQKHEAVIVLEDDLVFVPGTYAYLSAALDHYRDTPQVMSVTGWTHPRVTPKNLQGEPYLDGRAECWSWGTWRRAWQGMEATDALTLIKECRARGIWPRKYGDDLPQMAQVEHQKNIWAVRWLYWHMLKAGLCLRPPHSLVEHVGVDSSATNVGADNAGWLNPPLAGCPRIPVKWPDAIEHPECLKLWRKACKQPAKTSPLRQVAAKIGALIPWSKKKDAAREQPTGGDVVFSGNYATWAEASANCQGYGTDAILERVRSAALQVKTGQAYFERDGITFDQPGHPWPVLAALLRAVQRKGGPVRVVDFGGSLGSVYFQTRQFLGPGAIGEWCVVEQTNFVEAGRREFEDGILRFSEDAGASLEGGTADVLLLSGVLQYLPDPHEWMDRFVSWSPRHIVLDRTPVWPNEDTPEIIAIQTVSATIYPAKYPMRFLNRRLLLRHFENKYELAAHFKALDSFQYEGNAVPCQGFVFDLKSSTQEP